MQDGRHHLSRTGQAQHQQLRTLPCNSSAADCPRHCASIQLSSWVCMPCQQASQRHHHLQLHSHNQHKQQQLRRPQPGIASFMAHLYILVQRPAFTAHILPSLPALQNSLRCRKYQGLLQASKSDSMRLVSLQATSLNRSSRLAIGIARAEQQ